jgi:hypothetical protein
MQGGRGAGLAALAGCLVQLTNSEINNPGIAEVHDEKIR